MARCCGSCKDNVSVKDDRTSAPQKKFEAQRATPEKNHKMCRSVSQEHDAWLSSSLGIWSAPPHHLSNSSLLQSYLLLSSLLCAISMPKWLLSLKSMSHFSPHSSHFFVLLFLVKVFNPSIPFVFHQKKPTPKPKTATKNKPISLNLANHQQN